MLKRLLFTMTIFCFLSGANLLHAQETTADIQGTVTSNNSGFANAVVTAIHVPTGTKYVTTTRNDGRYNIPNAKVGGPYTITVTFVGYKSEKQENIFLSLGQEFKSDFAIAPETKTLDAVVVRSVRQDKNFNNAHTGSQELITRSQIEQLPSISRSLADYARLEPTANGSSLSFGGRSNQYNNVTVDGANFNNSFGLSGTLGGQTSSQPISLEAIDQIQVNVAPYDVRQGGFTGAGLNSVTRSGTNQFKGSVYTVLKGAGTQGYFVDNTVVTKTPINFYTRGFTIGGPIIKNKVFFFLSGEEVHQEVPATSYIASDASHPVTTGSISKANADTLNALSNFLQTKFGYNPGAYQGYNFLTQSKK